MGEFFGSGSGIVFENSRRSERNKELFLLKKSGQMRYVSENESTKARNFSHIYLANFSVKATSVFFYSQLSYIGQDLEKIPPVLYKMYGSRVDTLDLSYNSITTLQGVQNFIHLKELILDNNRLSDNLIIPKMQSLHTFSVNKNKICNLELFIQKVQENIPCIRYLSLLGNKACPNQLSDLSKDEEDYKRYRYYVINQLPRLQFLDSTPVTIIEKEEARRIGHLMKIAKPLNVNKRDEEYENSPQMKYTPLPKTGRNIDDHQGAYGKCRYRYSGKHSEGNRFIQNNDL